MIKNIRWESISFEVISPPPLKMTQQLREQGVNYIVNKTQVGIKALPVLTREAALLLTRLHPLIVWGKKYHCICGQRILTLITPHLKKEDQITVGILPQSTKDSTLIELAQADTLLSQIAFSSRKGAQDIYLTSREIDGRKLGELSPALAGGMESCSKALGVSGQSLYNYRNRENRQRPHHK